MAQTRGVQDVLYRVRAFDQRFRAAAQAVLAAGAARVEARMQREHPWQNRTGAAERGLRATVVAAPSRLVLVAYHTVPYGVYLEHAHGGRFQVLLPTLRSEWPRILAALRRAGRGGDAAA